MPLRIWVVQRQRRDGTWYTTGIYEECPTLVSDMSVAAREHVAIPLAEMAALEKRLAELESEVAELRAQSSAAHM